MAMLLLVGGNGPELGDHGVVAHVPVMPGLVFKTAAQARPQLPVAEEPIDEGRRPPRRRLAGEIRGQALGIGPAMAWLVTAHAGNRAGLRPARVPEELLAERDLLWRRPVVIRDEGGPLVEPERKRRRSLRSDHAGAQNDGQDRDGGDDAMLHVMLLPAVPTE